MGRVGGGGGGTWSSDSSGILAVSQQWEAAMIGVTLGDLVQYAFYSRSSEGVCFNHQLFQTCMSSKAMNSTEQWLRATKSTLTP